jgi:uncharacterized membrane protein
VFAEYSDAAYDTVKVLHILSAIVGIGAVFLNGIYGRQAASRRGREGLAIFQANFLVSKVAEYFIYAIFVFGVLLVLLSDDAVKFEDTFVWLSMVLYLIALGISHGLLTPRAKKMEALMTDLVDGPPPGATEGGPPPQALELERLGKQLGIYGTALNVLAVLILVLMVTKPR